MITIIGKTDDAELIAEIMDVQMNICDADISIHFGRIANTTSKVNINSNHSLRNAKDKYLSLQLFRDYGLPTPNFSKDKNKLKYPMLGRKFFHSKGRDIIVIKNKEQYHEPMDYYIEFMEVQEEYRYHIIGRKVFSKSIKVGGNPNTYCRNLETGWTFRELKDDEFEYPLVNQYCRKAVESLELDFGAVDIIISNNKPYLLEVNTAPGLIPRRAKRYVKNIRQYLEFYHNDLMFDS